VTHHNGATAPVVEMETLAAPRLAVLRMPVPLDGRVTAVPADGAGESAFNTYLLTEGDDALLVDTGFPAYEQAMVSQLRPLVREGRRLSVFPLRLGEFDSSSNALAIASAFRVEKVYGIQDNGLRWISFGRPLPAGLDYEKIGQTGTIRLGRPPTRTVTVLAPLLRLLQTHWLFDEATGTLFTSDSFGYAKRAVAGAGPWVLRPGDADATTVAHVRRWMLSMRYWWLSGARTDALRADLAEIFERFAVRRIAPAYGCVLEGAEVVARHVDLVDRALAALGSEQPRVEQAA